MNATRSSELPLRLSMSRMPPRGLVVSSTRCVDKNGMEDFESCSSTDFIICLLIDEYEQRVSQPQHLLSSRPEWGRRLWLPDACYFQIAIEIREVDSDGRTAFLVRVLRMEQFLELVFQVSTHRFAVRHTIQAWFLMNGFRCCKGSRFRSKCLGGQLGFHGYVRHCGEVVLFVGQPRAETKRAAMDVRPSMNAICRAGWAMSKALWLA